MIPYNLEVKVKEFLSTEDIAQKLGISRQHVVKQMKAGLLPYVRRGHCLRVPRVAWEAWLASQAHSALERTREDR